MKCDNILCVRTCVVIGSKKIRNTQCTLHCNTVTYVNKVSYIRKRTNSVEISRVVDARISKKKKQKNSGSPSSVLCVGRLNDFKFINHIVPFLKRVAENKRLNQRTCNPGV